MTYQIDGDAEQNRMHINFSPKGQNCDLGVRPKGQISLNYSYKVDSKVFLYETLNVFTQIKDIIHIERNFHYVAWVMHHGWTWGCWGQTLNHGGL